MLSIAIYSNCFNDTELLKSKIQDFLLETKISANVWKAQYDDQVRAMQRQYGPQFNKVLSNKDAVSALRLSVLERLIDNVAVNANYNLEKRTCKMITGQLVLPSTPTVTGYGSYYPCQPVSPTTGA